MIKKLLITAALISTVSFAATKPPMNGCILAQEGEVLLHWTTEDNKIQDIDKALYSPIKKEGSNFRKIIVGSKLQWKAKEDKSILVEFTDIKADKRVKGKPRTGNIKAVLKIANESKDLDFKYSFANNLMEAKSSVDYLKYTALNFKMKIKAILCTIPNKKGK